MRRLIAALCALCLALVAVAQPPTFPPLNVGNAKLVATSPDLGTVVNGVALSEDKGVLVAACADGSLRRWKVEAEKDPIDKDSKGDTLSAHTTTATCVGIGGAVLLSGSTDGKVLVCSLPGDKPAHTIAFGAPVRAVAVSGDGKHAAAGGDANDVQVIDPATGKVTKKLTGPTDWIGAIAFSPDGKHIAAGGHDGKLWLWETESGKKVFDVLAQSPPKAKETPETNVVTCLAFSADGKLLALGGSDPKGCLFQANDGKFLRNFLGHTGAITGVVFHPSGQTLFSTSKDRSVRAWNPAGGNGIKTLDGHTSWAEGLVLMHKGTKAISVGADKTARLWDLGAPPPAKPKK